MSGITGKGIAGKTIKPDFRQQDGRPLFPTIRNLPGSGWDILLDSILNLFYPNNCFICAAPMARRQDQNLCSKCWHSCLMLEIVPPSCPSCGIPFAGLAPDDAHLCGKCILNPPPFAGARSFGYYTEELSRAIQEFKFRGRKDLARLFAPCLMRTYSGNWEAGDFDLIVPVPLHRSRKHKRGYNQSALLARSLSKLIHIPCCEKALKRKRNTVPQVGLSDTERIRNVQAAFFCPKPEMIAGKKMLLIDDVMTTGATVASVAACLRNSGAARVSALTLARAVR
jgi:ComF family protein